MSVSSGKKSFWKRSTSFPGSSVQAASSQKQISSKKTHKLTFEEFENHTEDAWDDSEDDLLRAALAKLDTTGVDKVRQMADDVIAKHEKDSADHVEDTINDASQTEKIESIREIVENDPLSSPNGHPSKKFPGVASRTRLSQSEAGTEGSTEDSSTTNKNGLSPNQDGIASASDAKDVNNTPPTHSVVSKNETSTSKITLSAPSIENAGSAPKAQSIRIAMVKSDLDKENSRVIKFSQVIDAESTDLDALRKLSWSGIPMPVRSTAWQLLSAYLPANKDRRQSVLTRKRNEYFNFVKQYYDQRTTIHQETYHQIHIDIPRTNPLIPLFQQEAVQHIFERLLFIWAVRHPASGYVQGINDLVTPFFIVFLTSYISPEDCERVETFDVGSLDTTVLEYIEADTYWCMSKLLDGIQDNYTFAQPGIQKKVNMLRELTKRVDADLHAHLESENIEYLQFAFRWMNNLLMREIPLRCTIRLWDTYFAEADGFCDFHIYVCAAFLKQWRSRLLGQDFQELMLTIQNVPTNHWGSEEVKLLLAEAFRLKYTFHDSKSHLTDGPIKR